MADNAVHLYRGAPGTRSWSRYQHTIQAWTLCGIRLIGSHQRTRVTESEWDADCAHCLDLARTSESGAREENGMQEAARKAASGAE